MNNIRTRRMSAPFHSSQRDLLAETTGATPMETPVYPPRVPPTQQPSGHENNKQGKDPADNSKAPRREFMLQLFSSHASKQEQNDSAAMLASLQTNVMGLTASNQREKAMNEHLTKQIHALTQELTKTKELYDEEKTKNEKLGMMRKQQQKQGDHHNGYLPDIHSTAAAAAAAVALQQQAQLEISYQRKILSLENRYKDLMDNNKRLLRKIEQLEKTEADTDALIDNLRQENVRLGAQVDNLSTTVASQSSLILGLRTSLQKLNQDEHQLGSLMKKFDRSQIDLEITKVREKMLRDEHERMKQVMTKEKESLMAKIMDFQQRLQGISRTGDDADALHERIRRLENEKRLVVEEMVTLRENFVTSDRRMHEQEQMTNRLLLETEASQMEKKVLVSRLALMQEELASKASLESRLSTLEQREKEVEQLMARTVDLQGELDTANEVNRKLQQDVDAARQLQLSHDETVQALQLARQKAATHEALTLVNEEKEALHRQLEESQGLLAELSQSETILNERIKDVELELSSTQSRLQELSVEVIHLRERPVEQVVVEKVLPPSAAEIEERQRVEADIMRLRSEYDDMRQTFETMETEYNKLVTKRYKTESFQNQVKLLQNENNALAARVEDLLRDEERDRAQLQARAMEILELQERVPEPQAIEILRKTQESLESTVSSLVEAEIASESTFTCLQCMRLFVNPLTLTPCGHTYCSSCVDSMGNTSIPSSVVCKECKSTQREETESIFPNQALADLTARFIFRQQTLSSLTTMCLSLRNSFANRSAGELLKR